MNYLIVAGAIAVFAVNTVSLGAQTITVSPSACQAFTAHSPRDDVAYKPGVDVSGNAVTPTDRMASRSATPDLT